MKIVFVTYNLAFISNWIERLQPFMQDYQFIVLHIAKLQSSSPKIIDNASYYDITDLSYVKLNALMRTISPHLCIFFNFRSLLELLLQRVCIQNGIKQVYLEHGFISQNTTHFKTQKVKKTLIVSLKRQFNFWCKYCGNVFHSKTPIKEMKVAIDVFFRGNFSTCPFDYYFIYSQREFDRLSRIYMLAHNYSYIGYPIFLDEKQKEISKVGFEISRAVLYVHQPFILDGFASISYDEEKQYILSLSKNVSKKYGRLVVLLHPRENLESYKERYKDTDVEIVSSPNNYLCFADKSLIIGHYSTALLYALYLGKPTVIIEYPTSKNDPIFKECFVYLADASELETVDILVDSSMKQYFAGPVNTYEYVAKQITSYIEKH